MLKVRAPTATQRVDYETGEYAEDKNLNLMRDMMVSEDIITIQ